MPAVDIARYLRTISNDFGGIFFTGFVEYFLRVNMIGGIALLEAAADRIIDECKKDAPQETGWCKIRDAFVVPAAINIGLYVLKVVLEKAAAEG